MSNKFVVALLAGVLFISPISRVSWAEESPAGSEHACCDKNKDGQCTGCECTDGKCTGCKCKNGQNPDDALAICPCDGTQQKECHCSGIACAACDEAGCQFDATASAGCHEGDCGQSLFESGRGWRASIVTDAIWQQIANELEETTRSGCCHATEALASQKPAVYLILDEPTGGDCAIQVECGPGTTVGSVLHGALPHPVNFAAADITVHRTCTRSNENEGTIEAEVAVLPVRWDQSAGEPTACTDHALQPNDRIRVSLAAASEAAPQAVATPHALPPTPHIAEPRFQSYPQPRAAAQEGATQIQYSIQIIEDSQGCLAEYDALRQGAPMMFAESKSLLPAIRMLAKNDLVKQTSSPKIICAAGQKAELEIDDTGAESVDGVRLEVAGEAAHNGLMVEVAMHSTDEQRHVGVCTSLLIEEGQTIVLNANSCPDPTNEAPVKTAVYIVVTPEI